MGQWCTITIITCSLWWSTDMASEHGHFQEVNHLYTGHNSHNVGVHNGRTHRTNLEVVLFPGTDTIQALARLHNRAHLQLIQIQALQWSNTVLQQEVNTLRQEVPRTPCWAQFWKQWLPVFLLLLMISRTWAFCNDLNIEPPEMQQQTDHFRPATHARPWS